MKNYVIGLDYGSDSVRAVLLEASTGDELATSVHHYRRWSAGDYCDPSTNQFRQHPWDHIEGLEKTITTIINDSGVPGQYVKGICVDTTGSSPVAVNKKGAPLCLTPGFEENPNAMVVLWKDHTAIKEAEEINYISRNWGGEDFTKYEGGIYSSEWFWAKILHIIRKDEGVKKAAYSWVEHCDLMTNILIGNSNIDSLKRSRCAAGHKAMWHRDWDGLPPKKFFQRLDPYLADLRDRLYQQTYTSDVVAGHLSTEWAERLGLSKDTVVAVGTFDAHAGAIGAQVEEHALVRVMGTSTCDMMITPREVIGGNTVKGICGQVDGSIIPGMIGLEAGQSAFGDFLAWFKTVAMWSVESLMMKTSLITEEEKLKLAKEIDEKILGELSKQAEAIPLSESIPVALDWINGRRTPDANQALKSAISNLSLGTKAPHIFKALVHSICFGSKKIVDRFEEEGIEIRKIIAIGGVARKSPYIMQTLANILNRPIVVIASDQAPALGAAIYAAVAAGLYSNVLEASKKLSSEFEAEYLPQSKQVVVFKGLMEQYNELAEFIENSTTIEN